MPFFPAVISFDKDKSGCIDVWELRQVLEAMGQKPTEEELFQMISEVDENMSGAIEFSEFIRVIEKQKERAARFDDETDLIDAFVACGGNADKTGCVSRDRLVRIIKVDFGLNIEIEHLIDQLVSYRWLHAGSMLSFVPPAHFLCRFVPCIFVFRRTLTAAGKSTMTSSRRC